MERLRQTQQHYEQELISKGILPYTTEEAIRQHAEQQQSQIKTDRIDLNRAHHVETSTLSIDNHFLLSEKLFNRLYFSPDSR